MRIIPFSIPLLALAAAVCASEMEMGHAVAPAHNAAVNDSTELIPLPHEMTHKHGLPILEMDLTPAERLYWENYNTTTFFTIGTPHKSALWVHVATLAIAFILLYPVSLVLFSAKSKWYIPVLTIYDATIVASLLSLQVFAASAPDLYPGNCYGKMSWILLVATAVHYVIAVLSCASQWISGDWLSNETPELAQAFIPLEDLDLESGSSHSPAPSTLIDSDNNGGHTVNGSPRGSGSPGPEAYKDSLDLGEGYFDKTLPKSNSSRARDGILSKIFLQPWILSLSERFQPCISLSFTLINMPMLSYLFIYSIVGISVGNLLGQGVRVFNLLAHFIKGGVFFTLGIFYLARYCGCQSQYGLAWNKCVVLKNQVGNQGFYARWMPRGMFTMEFYESFLIFFYGSTNIFLEHLASPGGAWDAKDLQHASIAFMYIGAGLCGLITEIILSDWRFSQVMKNTNINPTAIHAASPGFSPNPFPAFTIFWTGILMSQHKQASEISSVVHEQWGYLLSYGSFFRLFTFVLLMLVPNKNLNPSRPFTELITSFCLLAGGAIFMQSTDQVVEALEWRGLTSMFTLNVNVGCIVLLMSWEMVLLIWRDRMEHK